MGNRANAQTLRNELHCKCEANPNGFEERLIALEEQVLELNSRVDALEGKEPSVQDEPQVDSKKGKKQ